MKNRRRKRWAWWVAVLVLCCLAGLGFAILVPSPSELPFQEQLKPIKPKGWSVAPAYQQNHWLFARERGMAVYEGSATKDQINGWVKTLKANGWKQDPNIKSGFEYIVSIKPRSDMFFQSGSDSLWIKPNMHTTGFKLDNGREWGTEARTGSVAVVVVWGSSDGLWQKVKRTLHLGP